MGSASGERIEEERGYFDGTIFNNGRIIMEVGKDYAVMKDARNGEVLIERIYPQVQVREGEEWRGLEFEKEIRVDENNGWNSVSILMEHRVIWKYEGVYVRNFEVIDNGINWNSADIQVYYDNKWPSANVGGIKNSNEHIYLPHNWDGSSYPWGYSWTHSNAYRTIVHELGHYALFLYDEYIDADGNEYPRVHDDATGYDIPEGPHSFMNFQYKYSEMTSEYNYTHWSPPSGYKTTMQRYINRESCWETFFRMYNSVNGEYKKVIEFDLNGDSIVDSAFWDSYIPKPGPVLDFSDIMEVLIYDF